MRAKILFILDNSNIKTFTLITQATNIDPLKANAPFKLMHPTTATYRHVVGVFVVIVGSINFQGIIINVQAPYLDLDIFSINLTVRKYNFLCQLKYNSPSEENYI